MKKFAVLMFTVLLAGAFGNAQAGGDAAAGKAKAKACAGCHGAQGVTKMAKFPNLAGQNPAYFVDALKAYKNGGRKGGTAMMMIGVAKKLSDADMANLAAYYHGLK